MLLALIEEVKQHLQKEKSEATFETVKADVKAVQEAS